MVFANIIALMTRKISMRKAKKQKTYYILVIMVSNIFIPFFESDRDCFNFPICATFTCLKNAAIYV